MKETASADPCLPEDIKSFLRDITLWLQITRHHSEKDAMFRRAYSLYDKYKIDPKYDNGGGE